MIDLARARNRTGRGIAQQRLDLRAAFDGDGLRPRTPKPVREVFLRKFRAAEREIADDAIPIEDQCDIRCRRDDGRSRSGIEPPQRRIRRVERLDDRVTGSQRIRSTSGRMEFTASVLHRKPRQHRSRGARRLEPVRGHRIGAHLGDALRKVHTWSTARHDANRPIAGRRAHGADVGRLQLATPRCAGPTIRA